MNTPLHPAKSGMHPMLLIAAVAVILFCAVGTAAIMGWLPKSSANGDLPPATAAQLDAQAGAQPSAAPVTALAPVQLAAANAAP